MAEAGYTDAQARKLAAKLDRNLARAEETLFSLCATVPEASESVAGLRALMREAADRQAAVIAQRLREPTSPVIHAGGLTALLSELDYREQVDHG